MLSRPRRKSQREDVKRCRDIEVFQHRQLYQIGGTVQKADYTSKKKMPRMVIWKKVKPGREVAGQNERAPSILLPSAK